MWSIFNFHLVAVIFSVDLLAMTGDSTMTWTSPMFVKLYSNDSTVNPLDKPITPEQDAWIGSLINIGAMIGPFLFTMLAEKYGRKVGLLAIAIPHFISFLTFAFAHNIYLFYFGRLFGGLSQGAGYSLMPMYMAEIAEDSNRGMISTQLNCFWTFGNLVPYVVGPYVSAMWLNLLLATFPAIFFITFFFVGPETPYYLMKHGKEELVEKSLRRIRLNQSNEAISKEMDQIRRTLENESEGSVWDIFRSKPLIKALIITCILMVLSQVSGINALLFYMQFIFQYSGTDIPDEIACIIFGCVLFLSSLLTPFLSDRIGRKKLLVTSCLGTCTALTVLGFYFYVDEHTDFDASKLSWLPLASLITFIIFFNVGLGPLTLTIASELFPSNVKSASASLASCTLWFSSFMVTNFFNQMIDTFEHAGSFWFFAGCTLIGAVFCFFFVPETKGKSFIEIQKMLIG